MFLRITMLLSVLVVLICARHANAQARPLGWVAIDKGPIGFDVPIAPRELLMGQIGEWRRSQALWKAEQEAEGGIAGSCPGTGSCFVAHTTPGCNIAECCQAVCSQDPFCCNNQWDSICAGAAGVICATCGGDGAGSCFSAHANPSCNNAECCEAVCAQDAFCCDTQWDNICANAAGVICAVCGFPGAGSCFAPHPNAACSNEVCCDAVCAQDPFCCDVEWDSICANAAGVICVICGGAGTGDCFGKHSNGACNDAECCKAVCAQDPFCCDAAWDFICVDMAEEICASCGGAAAGDCFSAHDIPACNNAECCQEVCAIDPFCCDVEWDGNCVNQANVLCVDCPAADIAPPPNGNTVVNVDDLLYVIDHWGACPAPPAQCLADIAPVNGNGVVDIDDLLSVIDAWGACP